MNNGNGNNGLGEHLSTGDDSGGEQQEIVSSPHDGFFRFIMEQPENARSWLEDYLPPAILAKLDLSTLEISKDTFIDKKMSRYASDILYHVRMQGKPAFIYTLFEHKSYYDPLLVFQLLKYMIRIWELFLKKNPDADTLPVIIPLIIYHGREKWPEDRRFARLFGDIEGLEMYIPEFQFQLNDYSHLPDEEIKGNIQLRLLLMMFKYISRPDLAHKLPDIIRLLLDISGKERFTEVLEVMLRYITSAAQDISGEKIQETLDEVLKDGGNIMSTLAQKWKQEGIDIGWQQGKQEGIDIGWQEGKQEGSKDKALAVALQMMADGLAVQTIAKYTGLSYEEIKELKSQKSTAH